MVFIIVFGSEIVSIVFILDLECGLLWLISLLEACYAVGYGRLV